LDELGEFLDCVGWVGVFELLVSAYEAERGVQLHRVKLPLVKDELLPCADVYLPAYGRYDCGGREVVGPDVIFQIEESSCFWYPDAHEVKGAFSSCGLLQAVDYGELSQRKSTRSRCVSVQFLRT